MDAYGTHLEALVRCVMATKGPVVELGAGYYSTPILSAICKAQGRRFVTYESNKDWLGKFSHLNHEMIYVENYDDADLSERWSVAFVDHAPALRRIVDIERLAHSELVVVHDTEPREKFTYEYSQVLPKFTYSFTDDRHSVWTTVVSNLGEIRI